MRKMAVLVCLISALAAQGSVSAQDNGVHYVTTAQFRAALATAKQERIAWSKTINGVELDQLNLDYRTGKQIEDYLAVTNQDMKNVVLFADRVEREDTFFNEVNLALAVQELSAQVNLFGATLSIYNIRDQATQDKLTMWNNHLTDLAVGPIQKLYTASSMYVTERAALLDQDYGADALKKTAP